MRSSSSPQRYVLVPRAQESGSRPVKRFSLARVAVTPRSALGEDRHARMERAAGHDRPTG